MSPGVQDVHGTHGGSARTVGSWGGGPGLGTQAELGADTGSVVKSVTWASTWRFGASVS